MPTAQAWRRATASPASERDEQRDAVDEDVGAEEEDEHRERRLRPDECEDAEHERRDPPDREHPPLAGH